MQARTGARIQVIPLHLPPGDMSKERTVQIDGTSEQIEAAKQLVEEVTSELFSRRAVSILLAIFVPLIVTNGLCGWRPVRMDFCGSNPIIRPNQNESR
ncbi:hypothetical protein OROGR_010816 [Orobanche gracilis]